MIKILNPLIISLFVLTGISTLSAQDAATILKKMDDVMYSAKDMSGKNRIVLINKSGKQEIREATIIQKGNDKRLFRFTSPSSQAGIAVLSLPDDVMYLYLPAFGKERRIATSAKNQNFAGTDFSYSDMESVPFSQKYTPKLLNSSGELYTLELTPTDRSEYSKVIVTIDRSHYFPHTAEYFDKGNNKIKEGRYTFKKIGNYWNASEIEMTDLKKGHITKFQMSDVIYDSGVSDDEFTVRKLSR